MCRDGGQSVNANEGSWITKFWEWMAKWGKVVKRTLSPILVKWWLQLKKKKALIIAVTQILPCESRATCAFVFFCVIACTCLCTSLTCKRVHQHSGCPCMCVCVSPRLDKACYSLAVPPCHRRGLSVSASVWSISRGPVVVSGQQWIWLSLTPLSLSLSPSHLSPCPISLPLSLLLLSSLFFDCGTVGMLGQKQAYRAPIYPRG